MNMRKNVREEVETMTVRLFGKSPTDDVERSVPSVVPFMSSLLEQSVQVESSTGLLDVFPLVNRPAAT